jgi:hypothetical protein
VAEGEAGLANGRLWRPDHGCWRRRSHSPTLEALRRLAAPVGERGGCARRAAELGKTLDGGGAAMAGAPFGRQWRPAWVLAVREQQGDRGECGVEGAGPGLKHGKVAASARQVAASAAQASHVARTASKVTTLFRNFKIPIPPQTYH